MSDEGFNWDLDMDEALDLDFEGWQPAPGDKVIGTVLNVTMSEPGTWGSYPIISIATREGGISVHCFHSVLRKAVAHAQVGDFIGIKYKGQRQGANQVYEDYNVILKAQGGALTGGSVSQALPSTEKPALPNVAQDPTPAPNVAQEAAQEPQGWQQDEIGNTTLAEPYPASPRQHAAINKLRAAAKLDPIDWTRSIVTEEEASQLIAELQS
jgi:hypothetical protein